MKKLFIMIFVGLLLVSCKDHNNKNELDSLKLNKINEIVKTIIVEDSLNILSSNKDSKMFCEELFKLKIYIPEKNKGNGAIPPPPPPPSTKLISIENLMFYFETKDSLCLMKQNSNPDKIKIDKLIHKNINFTTISKELKKRKQAESYTFYEMSIPIFSNDDKKAYVELNYYCGGLCGGGTSIYLEIIRGKWKIIDKRRTWISC